MSYNPFSLEGKKVLITGASSGIGRAAAIECSKVGAQVFLTGRSVSRLEETLNHMDGKEEHQLIPCDLSDSKEMDRLIDTLPEIQGVVNNAGYTIPAPIPFIDKDTYTAMLSVNTVAPIYILRTLLKKKKIKRGASIVFTSSLAALGKTYVGNTMYASCKGAISAFVQGAALELSAKGIRVNAVCPGMVETNILSSGAISEEQIEIDKKNYPLHRYGRPEEIAWAMIYLLSDASAWTTGINLVLDGGYSIK